jgi:autotransporter-associated beta strand protein
MAAVGNLSIGSATFRLNNVTTSPSMSGVISGTGTFAKAGIGTLLLSGANTFTGATQVEAGRLDVTGALPGSILVAAGAVLGGTGTTGPVSALGGQVSPGLSPGILSTGNVIIGTGALSVELTGTTVGTGYDQLNVTGTVSLGADGSATLVPALNFVPPAGTEFRIINNDGADPVAGEFTGLPNGSVFNVNGVALLILYTGGDGNDVTLTVFGAAVPAMPWMVLLVTALMLAALAASRSRRAAIRPAAR